MKAPKGFVQHEASSSSTVGNNRRENMKAANKMNQTGHSILETKLNFYSTYQNRNLLYIERDINISNLKSKIGTSGLPVLVTDYPTFPFFSFHFLYPSTFPSVIVVFLKVHLISHPIKLASLLLITSYLLFPSSTVIITRLFVFLSLQHPSVHPLTLCFYFSFPLWQYF